MNKYTAIALVFVGCCSNVIFLELIIREQPGSGNIITFAQFLFIAIEGFIFTTNFGRKSPAIPLRRYALMVVLFVLVNLINNYAFTFNIPYPLHVIFRAGSLIANLVLGVIILHRRYNLSKYLSVIMITVGIALSTLASADHVANSMESTVDENGELQKYGKLGIGVAMLTTALFLSAYMGIYQETVYTKHGKHPAEALFYNHALPLPFFLLLSNDILNHTQIFTESEHLLVPVLDTGVPKLWLYLLGNCLTQYVCIKSVFVLTTECSSLTVTLVVTLRKFVSLIFSIIYFSNPFTYQHWIGTVLVFSGTILFVEIIPKAFGALNGGSRKAVVREENGQSKKVQ